MSVMNKIFGAFKPAPTDMMGKPINTNNNVDMAHTNLTNNLQTNPPPNGTAQSQQTAPNGIVPEKASEAPLDQFKDVWNPTPVDPNAPQDIPIDAAKIFEAAGKVNFSQVLSREDLAKVSEGGEGAVQILIDSMNKISQATYGQSIVAANKMVDIAVAKATKKFEDSIPNLVKKQALGDNLYTKNPAFSNPAIAPVIEALKSQLAEKFPKATPTELTSLAENYLSGAAALISPPSQMATKKGPAEEDWEMYLKDPS